MDDKLFEEKMLKLKSSYEHLPPVSSPEKIMNDIKENEKLSKRHVLFQLPYVASFIGVLLISGILGIQFITQSEDETSGRTAPAEERNSQQITNEDIETAINETRGYYERRVDELKNELNFEDVEQYAFVQEAKNAVEKFEARKNYASQTELTSYMERVKEIIKYRVSIPQEEFKLLLEKEANGEKITAEELYAYIDKLEILHEQLYEQWNKSYTNNQQTIDDIESYIDELNAGTIKTEDQQYIEICIALKTYGYSFFNEGEGMINFAPDYQNIYSQLEKSLNEDAKVYLKIKSEKKALLDGELVISHKDLGKRLLEIEDFVLNNPVSTKVEELKEQYVVYLTIYLKGSDNTILVTEDGVIKPEVKTNYESLLNEYEYSETAKIVKKFYQSLEVAQFRLTNELRATKIEVPKELKPKSEEFSMNINLLPITTEMKAIYEEFKVNGDMSVFDQPLPGANSIELAIARIYMYAVEKGDEETAANLLTHAENGKITEQEAVKEKGGESPTDFQALSNDVKKVRTIYRQDGIVIEHIFTKENEEIATFRMRVENGYPKIEQNPL